MAGLSEGDPVAVVPQFLQTDYGTYGDHVVVPASAVAPRPAEVDPVRAAAVWMAYITAYGPLVESRRVRPGGHVLITAASSSVGLAAIQIARHVGAIPIATTRGPGKRQRLLEAGAAHVIVTDEEDLPARIEEFTGGEGVRPAFDPVAGPGVETLAQGIAPGGFLVVYGALDPRPTPLPKARSFPALNSSTYTLFETPRTPSACAARSRSSTRASAPAPSTPSSTAPSTSRTRRGAPLHGRERAGRQDRRHRHPRGWGLLSPLAPPAGR
ncbi:zinc-binding dehydrogenase [Streptomyces sp. NPDC013157]|uniref:zinc-binding dehydrogenase n=1 Tax=Streptomyces sp. NPDC013157 TaxID=3364861 RepID=UPI0036C58B7E